MAGFGDEGHSDNCSFLHSVAKKSKVQKNSSIVAALQRVPSDLQKVGCPACSLKVSLKRVNEHLDTECRFFEGPLHANTIGEGLGESCSKATSDHEDVSRCPRFTAKIDQEISQRIGTKLKGLVANRRASQSFKSSRDRRRRSSTVGSQRPNLTASGLPVGGGMCELADSMVDSCEQRHSIKKLDGSNHEGNRDGVLVTDPFSSSMDSSSAVSSSMDSSSADDCLPYYLRNFVTILDTVLGCNDRQLFNEEDISVLDSFQQLSLGSKKLYVRLFHRNYRWLSLHKVEYPDISTDLCDHVDELIASSLLESGDYDDLQSTLSLVSAPDLRQIAKSLHIAIPLSTSFIRPKNQLIQALLDYSRKQRSLLPFTSAEDGVSHFNSMKNVLQKKAHAVLGRLFRINKATQAVFERVLILFSMTRSLEDDEQSTTGKSEIYNLLQVNTGEVVYPSYVIDRPSLLFSTRDELLSYQDALHMEQDFVSYLENGNLEDAETLYGTIHAMFGSCADSTLRKPVLPDFLLRFSPGWIYTRIMGLAVEMLQKLRDYKGAVELLEQLLEQKAFCGGKRGYWWDRLALNLNQHLKLAEKSLDAISRGLADDHVRTGHRLALIGRARRICSSSSHTEFRDQIAKFPLPYQHEPKEVEINGSVIADGVSGRKTVFIMADESFAAEDGDFMLSSVEDLALKHYLQAEKWEHGLHAEGSSLTAVFCLLLWDVIFASGVPDVFRTKYQASPLDFDTDHFYESRKDLIEKRLATMSNANNDDLCDMIAGTWNTHYGQMCMGMNWNLFPGQLRDAQDLVVCIGGCLLSKICGRLAKDYHHCRGGVPDLTLWSPTTHTCKFVEVKGPGDRLSPKQVLWLDFLTGLGVDAEVCKVKAVGSRGIR